MKLLIAISCLFVITHASVTEEEFFNNLKLKLFKAGKLCKDELDVSLDDVMLIKNRKVPDSIEGKCFIACIYKKIRIMNTDGTFNLQNCEAFVNSVKEVNPEASAKIRAASEKCYPKLDKSAEECEVAAKGFACMAIEEKKGNFPNIGF